jgi:hypothetical protein
MLSGAGLVASGSRPPVFETEPHSAERAGPPTTSAEAPVPDALPDALTDPDLARIIGTWPTLPGPICRAILALVESAGLNTP